MPQNNNMGNNRRKQNSYPFVSIYISSYAYPNWNLILKSIINVDVKIMSIHFQIMI